jgi:hypothetical protein
MIETKGNDVRCNNCGSTATMNRYAQLTSQSASALPKSIQEWSGLQIENDMKSLTGVNLPITIPVNLEIFSLKTKEIESTGSGELKLDQEGWHFDGLLNGEEAHIFFPIDSVPALPFDPMINFQIYGYGKYHAFKPYNNLKACIKYSNLGECAYQLFASEAMITKHINY